MTAPTLVTHFIYRFNMSIPLLKNCKLPSMLELYDRTRDPYELLTMFNSMILLLCMPKRHASIASFDMVLSVYCDGICH